MEKLIKTIVIVFMTITIIILNVKNRNLENKIDNILNVSFYTHNVSKYRDSAIYYNKKNDSICNYFIKKTKSSCDSAEYFLDKLKIK